MRGLDLFKEPDSAQTYISVRCLACGQTHLVNPFEDDEGKRTWPKMARRVMWWLYLDRRGFYFACMAVIAIGTVAYFAIVAPIARALGLF